MPATKRASEALRRIVLGAASIHQYRPVALREPQNEVVVALDGAGQTRDVTFRNVVVSTYPLTIGIGFEISREPGLDERRKLRLRFQERQGDGRQLGEIRLRLTGRVPIEDGQLCLFEPRGCSNYCAGWVRLWTRYGYFGLRQWRARRRSGPPPMPVSSGQLHSLFVFYICPRPVMLISAEVAGRFNMVPMDLVGQVSAGRVSLALHATSTAAPLIERARRIAMSSVPFEQIAAAYSLGANHRLPCAEVKQLPFAVARSAAFGIPVPGFALRVRELEVESVRSVGGYRLYIARPVEDRRLSDGPQFFLVHGFYERLAQRDRAPGARQG